MRIVQWSDDALDDLEEQAVHMAKDNPVAARRVAKRIGETREALAEFATGHPGRISGTYEKSVSRFPCIVAYALSDDDAVLTILHVIRTSRNWSAGERPK